jgi:hypothetical protein
MLEGEFGGIPGFGDACLIDRRQCGSIGSDGRGSGQGRQRDQTQYHLSALQLEFRRT